MCQGQAKLCKKCNDTKQVLRRQILEQEKKTLEQFLGLETNLKGKVGEIEEEMRQAKKQKEKHWEKEEEERSSRKEEQRIKELEIREK